MCIRDSPYTYQALATLTQPLYTGGSLIAQKKVAQADEALAQLTTALTLDQIHYQSCLLYTSIAVSRFWSQRVSFSQPKQKYVILGVTGPEEYENNVDNNWYTNYSWIQCLKMTLRFLEMVAQQYPDAVSYTHLDVYKRQEIIIRYGELDS